MRIALASLALLCLCQVAQAAPIDELNAAEKKAYEAWGRLGLMQRALTFVTEPAKGYGMYQEKQSSIFKQGEKIITYIEPIGYAWKDIPHDMYEVSFVADVQIKSAKGDVLLDQKGFASTVLQSHNPLMEVYMNYTMTLTGAPAGHYTLVYTIHDVSGDQTMTVDQDFSISE